MACTCLEDSKEKILAKLAEIHPDYNITDFDFQNRIYSFAEEGPGIILTHRFEYTYSNTTKQALPWTPELLELKTIIEKETGETFNSCLLNLYHDGSEGMAWHSDGEKDLRKNGAIASVSFGAQRRFAFKHKETKEVINVFLEHGSLLVMKDETQTHWLHRLPPTKLATKPRVNLTFRTIVVK